MARVAHWPWLGYRCPDCGAVSHNGEIWEGWCDDDEDHEDLETVDLFYIEPASPEQEANDG